MIEGAVGAGFGAARVLHVASLGTGTLAVEFQGFANLLGR